MLDPIKCFRVAAIRLDSATFESRDSISETVLEQTKCKVQARRWTKHRFVDGPEAQFLLATVHFGVRLVDSQEGENPVEIVFYSIEAAFEAQFEVISREYDQKSFDDFIEKNVAHVIWPFWRHHVYSTLQAACLPILPIPLMAGHEKSSAQQSVPSDVRAQAEDVSQP